jgi:hypothetical protein
VRVVRSCLFDDVDLTAGVLRMSLFGSNEVVGSIRLRIVSGGEHECSADSSQTCYSKTPLESSQSWYDIFFTQQQVSHDCFLGNPLISPRLMCVPSPSAARLLCGCAG